MWNLGIADERSMLYLSDTDIVIFIWLPLVTPMFTHNFIIILAAKKKSAVHEYYIFHMVF